MLYPLLQQVKQEKGCLAVSSVTPSLIGPVVSLLNDLPGYLPSTDPERYRPGQRYSPKQDKERVSSQLHRYPKLRQRREGRINYDRVACHSRQDAAPGCPPYYPRDEV